MKLHHLAISLIAALLALSSCDKDEDIDRAYTDYRYDIVTFLGQNATGAVCQTPVKSRLGRRGQGQPTRASAI